MNFRELFLIGGWFLILCASGQSQTVPSSPLSQNQTNAEAPRLKTPQQFRYRLNPGDVVDISYRYTPEFNQTVTIQPDGFVTLQIVGELKVAGFTLEEARNKILETAAKRLKDPEVNLLLKEFQKPFFVVSGEVAQPGKFEMNQDMTALQAVMLAGGFKDSAKTSQILVFRKINSQTAEVKLLDLKGIKKTGDLENDFALESGDMILVPRNMITKVERYVRLINLPSIFSSVFQRATQ